MATPAITKTDVVIIGAGPAGLFAAFECSMLKMSCLLVDAQAHIGGQCSALYPEKPIFDIPAHPSISGEELVNALEKQIEPFSIPRLLGHKVEALTESHKTFYLTTHKNHVIETKAVIIAAGSGAFGPNRPPLKDIETFEQTGSVRYFIRNRKDFTGKHLVIAGGGDSALDWALTLKDEAASIALIHRRERFRAAPESLAQLERAVEEGKITKVVPYQLSALTGKNGQLETVEIVDLDGNKKQLAADYLLAFFGLSADLGPIAKWGLECTATHIPVTPSSCETTHPGIYAIGDVATYPGKIKLILQGFSEAAMAAHAIYPRVFPNTALHFEYSTSKGNPAKNTINA
ncbi:NAD(P)/FAD-dependent oxidoreductase [Entomobacter blattae]|nr:NAD(P)/FAD-dependent oxidoreductase [Entomobacter blattae]